MALDDILGRPGDQVRCRRITDMEVHFWVSPADVGDPCLCGATTRQPTVDDEPEEES